MTNISQNSGPIKWRLDGPPQRDPSGRRRCSCGHFAVNHFPLLGPCSGTRAGVPCQCQDFQEMQ